MRRTKPPSTPLYETTTGCSSEKQVAKIELGAEETELVAKWDGVEAVFLGVWPLARISRFSRREATYVSLLLSTGLTFGSIAALYGLSHGLIERDQYAVLVTAIILSGILPALTAERWFSPEPASITSRSAGADRTRLRDGRADRPA